MKLKISKSPNWSSILKSINEFWLIWIKDFIFYPLRYIENRQLIRQNFDRERSPIESATIKVCIHEWGGYNLSRSKNIKKIPPFECGLKEQLIRFNSEKKKLDIDLTVTMSDYNLSKDLDWIKEHCDHFIPVENTSMDFSGYNAFFTKIKNSLNSYVILSNSSVNIIQNEFLETYISYMESHPNIGLMGISASSKYYHTLIRNNFNPHIQSFFILTTLSVLKEIVSSNQGKFPGEGYTNKHLLIRFGEVGLSRFALKLGYSLAVVFDNHITEFNYKNYPLPLGDLRIHSKNPNSISSII